MVQQKMSSACGECFFIVITWVSGVLYKKRQ